MQQHFVLFFWVNPVSLCSLPGVPPLVAAVQRAVGATPWRQMITPRSWRGGMLYRLVVESSSIPQSERDGYSNEEKCIIFVFKPAGLNVPNCVMWICEGRIYLNEVKVPSNFTGRLKGLIVFPTSVSDRNFTIETRAVCQHLCLTFMIHIASSFYEFICWRIIHHIFLHFPDLTIIRENYLLI